MPLIVKGCKFAPCICMPSPQRTLGQNSKKSSMNNHWNHVIVQTQNVKKLLQRFNLNDFQNISTILFFKIAGFIAFMKIFPKNSTVIMDDFWTFEPCVRHKQEKRALWRLASKYSSGSFWQNSNEDIIPPCFYEGYIQLTFNDPSHIICRKAL